MNCPMNVVTYPQIAFKKLIFQARVITYLQRICIVWPSQGYV